MAHHTSPRGQSTASAGEEESELNYGSRVLETLLPQAARVQYYAMDNDEPLAARRPAGLPEPQGAPQLVRHRGCHADLFPPVQVLDRILERTLEQNGGNDVEQLFEVPRLSAQTRISARAFVWATPQILLGTPLST